VVSPSSQFRDKQPRDPHLAQLAREDSARALLGILVKITALPAVALMTFRLWPRIVLSVAVVEDDVGDIGRFARLLI
jgi:hypothetical protein